MSTLDHVVSVYRASEFKNLIKSETSVLPYSYQSPMSSRVVVPCSLSQAVLLAYEIVLVTVLDLQVI